MKNIILLWLFCLFSLASTGQAKADSNSLNSISNGPGTYSANVLTFVDANGTEFNLNGDTNISTLTYADRVRNSFPYFQNIAGTSVTGSFNGSDEQGHGYSASVAESLTTRVVSEGGSGRGGGYRPGKKITSVLGGMINYNFTINPPLPPAGNIKNIPSDPVTIGASPSLQVANNIQIPQTSSFSNKTKEDEDEK